MRFLTDENFDGDVLKSIRSRTLSIDMVRVQDVGLLGAPDPMILEWAAKENRILLTRDVRTMTRDALKRVEAGLTMPGVIMVRQNISIGLLIDDLEISIGAGGEEDFKNRVIYIPLT